MMINEIVDLRLRNPHALVRLLALSVVVEQRNVRNRLANPWTSALTRELKLRLLTMRTMPISRRMHILHKKLRILLKTYIAV